MEKKSIGRFIASLRKANGYTQEELASILNVSNKTISSWENDNSVPDLSIIVVLSDVFHVTCDELLRGEKNNEKKEETLEQTKKSEKVKNNLYLQLIAHYKNSELISIAILIVAIIFLLLAFIPTSKWFQILSFILFIILMISGFIFSKISYNNIVVKNDGENPQVNRQIEKIKVFILSVYSLFILAPILTHNRNYLFLNDPKFNLNNDEKTYLKAKEKIRHRTTLITGIIMFLIFMCSILLNFINPAFFGKGYTQQELMTKEYTFSFTFNENDKNLFVYDYEGNMQEINYSKYEEISFLKELPSKPIQLNILCASFKEYTPQIVMENEYTFIYSESSLEIEYKNLPILYLYKCTEGNLVYFSQNKNQYYELNNRYYKQSKKKVNFIALGLYFEVVICLGGIFTYTILQKKYNI